MAIKESQGGGSWANWPIELRKRDPQALEAARTSLEDAVARHIFFQFLFFRQWQQLHEHARRLGIKIIGDIPIFVSHDSADVWANLDLFFMDEAGQPTHVAGVPPDYFSPTGQRWGNPLYRWDVHKRGGYEWWISRFRAVLSLVDIVRLDHFRGFAGYWEIPADQPTAEIGQWLPGPGKDFMTVLETALGDLPIIAEDLGVITPDVVDLRDSFSLPGMKILQFAFAGGPEDPFLPHNYPRNCVVYTGTHDNDTSLGWFKSAPQKEQAFALKYLGINGQDLSWDMIRTIWRSVAMFALAPMQDLLSLGTEARMNYPGKQGRYWAWRITAADTSKELAQKLLEFNTIYSRKKTVETLER
jgi:4-alpha-glucanotransferase